MTTRRRPRITQAARAGLREMAGYWLTGLESWGRQFEAVPRTPEELRDINAALAFLGLQQIDLDRLGGEEEAEEE